MFYPLSLTLMFFTIFISTSISFPSRLWSPSITSDQLVSIIPRSASCAGAPSPDQCRTADQAAPLIASSFVDYGVTSTAEMAALIGTMAFESEDFQYNVNVYPGTPGQGTRNMQSAAFNLQYARSIPSLSSSLTAITTATSAGQLTAAQQNSVRGLLTSNDQYDFASAVWFLTSQCPLSIRSELQTGSLAGWQGYVGSCIGTAATSDRQAYWQRACGALGVDNH